MNDNLLERIAIALEKLAGVEEELGVFEVGSMGSRTTIYAAGANDIQQGIPWYELGENDNHISYAGKVIKGRLVDVRKVVKNGEFGEKEKLEIELESYKDGKPHTFIIAAGFTSVLSGSVLQKLAAIQGLKPGHIIGIYAEAGKKAVMSRVYSGASNEVVWCDWDTNYHAEMLLDLIRKTMGLTPTVKTSPTPQQVQPPQPQLDRGLLFSEVKSLQRRKNLADATLNSWAVQRFNVDLDKCNAAQLMQIKMGLTNYKPKVSR